jgi:hypothetical protein
MPAEGGACASAPAAKVAKAVPEAKPEADKSGAVSAATGAAVAGAAAAVAFAASGKKDPSKEDSKGPASLLKASAPGAARPATSAGGPAPSEGMVRESRPRRSAQASPRPPKVVRDVLKALGF